MIWGLLYLMVGIGLGGLELRRAVPSSLWARAASLLLFVLVWPLWAPVVLLGQESPRPERRPEAGSSVASRVSLALREAATIVSESSLTSLLPERVVEQVCECTATLEQRQGELVAAIAREEQALAACASPSRVRERNLQQLRGVQQRNQRALSSLEGLAESLRAQLLLVRHSGGPVAGVSELISELAVSVDSLSDWAGLEHADSSPGMGLDRRWEADVCPAGGAGKPLEGASRGRAPDA